MMGIKLDPNVSDLKARAAFEQIMKQSEEKFTALENLYKNALAAIEKLNIRLQKLE